MPIYGRIDNADKSARYKKYMTDQPSNNSLQDKILEAIKSGEVKPKSKWYFYGQSALLAMGLILIGLLLLFVGSLIIFSLKQNGTWHAAGFGFYGLKIFVLSLPWLLIIAVATLLVLLERLLKHYKFSYQQPMLYSFVGVGLLFVLGTIFVSRIHIHEELFDQTRENKLMFGKGVYRYYGIPAKGSITRGIVLEKNTDGCKIGTFSDEILQVLITPKTRLPYEYDFVNGDEIMVLGPRDDQTIRAVGIVKLGSGMPHIFITPTPHPGLLMPQFTQ